MAPVVGRAKPGARSHILVQAAAGRVPGEGGTAGNEGAVKGGTASTPPKLTASAPRSLHLFRLYKVTVEIPLVDGNYIDHEMESCLRHGK